MKQFFYTVALLFTATIAFGQDQLKVAEDLKVGKEGNNLLLTWAGSSQAREGSWQVEASVDGKEFSIIGLVWGPDPKSAGTVYSFKQQTKQLKRGFKHYRVQFVNAQQETLASKTIGFTK